MALNAMGKKVFLLGDVTDVLSFRFLVRPPPFCLISQIESPVTIRHLCIIEVTLLSEAVHRSCNNEFTIYLALSAKSILMDII